MSDVKYPIEDLKTFALKACLDVFELFHEMEIQEQQTPIRYAWKVGKRIHELDNE